MKKRVSLFLCIALLVASLFSMPADAKINVGQGAYGPFWSEQWVTEDTRGLWNGFYVLTADNVLRTDMVATTPGCWTIPGVQNGMVWEGTANACAPSDEADVGYQLNCPEGGRLRIILNGYMEVPGSTGITLAIYKNSFSNQVWPAAGGPQALASGDSVNIDQLVQVRQGDRLFFRFHSNAPVANSPLFRFQDFHVTWETSDQQAGSVIQSFSPQLTSSGGSLTYETPALNLAAKGRGLVRITLSNPSPAAALTLWYTTTDDPAYTTEKSVAVPVTPSQTEARQYLADLSVLYGYTGTVDRLKITADSISSGSMILEKVEILEGGQLVAPFTLSAKTTAASRAYLKSLSSTGRSYFPDGLMGVLPNSDGSYRFIGSNPLAGNQTVALFQGSLDNPFQSLVAEGISVQNTPIGYGPEQYNYVSVGQVYRFSGSECFTILHLERYFDNTMAWDASGNRSHANNSYFAASLGLGYSPDNGTTWYYAGEIATHTCESIHRYYGFGEQLPTAITQVAYSLDVGNGPFIVKDGYVYVYFIDFKADYSQTISVMRAPLNAVIQTARAKSTARQANLFTKYYNGGFTESAINGESTSVVDGACPPNFMSVIYSSYLDQYVLARCSSPAYATNDGDIVLNLSADPTDFRGRNYYIDASPRGSQYPTLVATGGANPSFETGQSVYLYYIDAPRDDRFLWDKADVVRRLITFD